MYQDVVDDRAAGRPAQHSTAPGLRRDASRPHVDSALGRRAATSLAGEVTTLPTAHHTTAQHTTAQHTSTRQHTATQRSTAQHSTT